MKLTTVRWDSRLRILEARIHSGAKWCGPTWGKNLLSGLEITPGPVALLVHPAPSGVNKEYRVQLRLQLTRELEQVGCTVLQPRGYRAGRNARRSAADLLGGIRMLV